jgi:PadR family transcriptional regulator
MKNNRTLQIRPCHLLEAVMLMTLRQWNSYGYELMAKSAAFWEDAINPGTVYRTLRQMEKNGDVASTWETTKPGPARRMYSITDAGEAYMVWSSASSTVVRFSFIAYLELP